jgi:hypothetical protein
VELYDIWYHRAELTSAIRSTIIPYPAHPFKLTIQETVALRSFDILRKNNMDLIRMFISASEERSSRVLGAMYVMTALTLVNKECAESYPWLFESATPGIYSRYRTFTQPVPLLNTLNFTNTEENETPIISIHNIPPLLLDGSDSA